MNEHVSRKLRVQYTKEDREKTLKRYCAEGVAALLVGGMLVGLLPQGAQAETASVGDTSVHESLFPHTGNGGYDALDYSVALSFRKGVTTMPGDASMTARSTQTLSSFSLDYAAGAVKSVTVDGEPARFRVRGEKLTVTPAIPIARGTRFSVRVRYTTDRAAKLRRQGTRETAWWNTDSGFALYAQPDLAHMVFPSNDHPSDKATYTVRITVPRGTIGISGGDLVDRRRRGAEETFTYRLAHPTASQVVQIAAGQYTERIARGPHGLPLRFFEPAGNASSVLKRELDRTKDEMEWLESRLGRYPFNSYGVLAVDGAYSGALETQTLSTIPAEDLAAEGKDRSPAAMLSAHELAHQWFGNHVALRTWSDMWLSEGHAQFYEYAYAADRKLIKDPSSGRTLTLEQIMQENYRNDQRVRDDSGPPAVPGDASSAMIGGGVYAGGALTLYALREEVGPQIFERIEREFLRTYGGGNAATEDYVRTASQVAGRDLSEFLHSWLNGSRTPPMPNHANWRPASG